jgi:hypothetical protein
VKKLAFVALGVLLAAVLSGCSTTNKTVVQKAKAPKTTNLAVDVRLSGATNVRGDISTCVGAGQFADIAAKTKVVVTNQQGQPLALGSISYGIGTDYYQDVLDECSFRVFVPAVPRAKGYTMIIGRQRPVPFPRAGVVATNGIFGFDLNKPNVPNPIYTTTTTTKK